MSRSPLSLGLPKARAVSLANAAASCATLAAWDLPSRRAIVTSP